MKRNARSARSHGRPDSRRQSFRPRLECLESRQMLAVSDFLFSLYDPQDGLSVSRYNGVTLQPTAGGVANNGPQDVGSVFGVAAMPDGTFYISNNQPEVKGVLHYANDGTFLGVLGAEGDDPDSPAATITSPGGLVYNPNDGLLYVSDINTAQILAFDTTAEQQWQPAESLFAGFAIGGYSFANDGSNDFIVGDLLGGKVVRYDRSNANDPIVQFDAGAFAIIPLALLAMPDASGDFLVADADFGFTPLDHHRILYYDASEDSLTQLIDFGAPFGEGGIPAQPSGGLVFDADGNLLVSVAPDHELTGEVQKYDISDLEDVQYLGALFTSTAVITGIAFVQPFESQTANRQLFYNQSFYDGNSDTINFTSDAAAIATDKVAYLPGDGTAAFANITSYTRGINGLVIDLAGGGNHASLSAGDFVFKISDPSGGNSNNPESWTAAPAPADVQVSIGGGVGGSDRVEIVWNAGAVINRWLMVQVKSNANTGLDDTFGEIDGNDIGDVFFFGNRVADGNGNFSTTNGDAGLALSNPGAATVTNAFDYNRNGNVTNGDAGLALSNPGMLSKIDIPAEGPFGGGGGGGGGAGDVGIASALAAASGNAPTAPLPVAVAARLDEASAPDSGGGGTNAYFAQLATDGVAEVGDADDDSLDALFGVLSAN